MTLVARETGGVKSGDKNKVEKCNSLLIFSKLFQEYLQITQNGRLVEYGYRLDVDSSLDTPSFKQALCVFAFGALTMRRMATPRINTVKRPQCVPVVLSSNQMSLLILDDDYSKLESQPQRGIHVFQPQNRRISRPPRRITFKGDELQGFAHETPASYIKLIFPEPGQDEPERPLPDAPRPKAMRIYTPLAVRPDVHEVDVDFVLHGEGPASTWASQAAVSQVIYLMGLGPGYALDTSAAQHLLIADDSALPAIENVLAMLPASASVLLLVEVISADEARPLQSAAQLVTQWLPRDTDHQAA